MEFSPGEDMVALHELPFLSTAPEMGSMATPVTLQTSWIDSRIQEEGRVDGHLPDEVG